VFSKIVPRREIFAILNLAAIIFGGNFLQLLLMHISTPVPYVHSVDNLFFVLIY